MRTMGKMDASIQGWYIDPTEVSICKRPEDGEDWLLGTGSYGKVRVAGWLKTRVLFAKAVVL